MRHCNAIVLFLAGLALGTSQAEAAAPNAVSRQGQRTVTVTAGVKGSVGPVSGAISRNGGYSVSASPSPYLGPVFSSNPKTGESSWGVGCPVGSLQLGGKGSEGKNNFVKVTAGFRSPVTPQVSVKIRTPSFTRAGMTSGSIKHY
jgi:hypothetical protein